MTVTAAHLEWDTTALGGDFAAYVVQRQHTSGWFDIARITDESTLEYDDYEAKRGVVETWRVLVEDTLGVRSPQSDTQAFTLSVGEELLITSNLDPTVNREILAGPPVQLTLPVAQTRVATAGRYGYRVHRSTDRLGEVWAFPVDVSGAIGPAMWRQLVEDLWSDLPYVCVLGPDGSRWFASFEVSTVDIALYGGPGVNGAAYLAAAFVEVTDTPSIVTVT